MPEELKFNLNEELRHPADSAARVCSGETLALERHIRSKLSKRHCVIEPADLLSGSLPLPHPHVMLSPRGSHV